MLAFRPHFPELKPLRLAVFSPVSLTSMAQRPHALARWLTSRGAEVVWVEPSPSRLPSPKDFFRILGRAREPANPEQLKWVWHRVQPAQIPIEPVLSGWVAQLQVPVLRSLEQLKLDGVVIGKPSILAMRLIERSPSLPLLVDVMDDMGAFHGGISGRYLERMEKELVSRADVVWVSARSLKGRVQQSVSGQSLLAHVPNGLDVARLAPLVNAPWRPRTGPRTVFGYLGTLGPWFDWKLVQRLAVAHPEAEIRLVGPVHTARPAGLASNIELRAAVRSEQVAQTLMEFDLGLIPFLKNRLTESVDPIKYYEYRAAGIPTLTTRFGAMADRTPAEGVWFLEDGLQSINRALEAREEWSRGEGLEARKAWVESCSWAARFDAAPLPAAWGLR